MDKETFLQMIRNIGTCEDEVQRRTMLSDLETDVGSIFDDNERLTNSNTALTQDNETLRTANMNLFLRIGEPKDPEEKKQTETKEKRKFDDLFNEKGGIK